MMRLALIIALIASPAMAQGVCGPRDSIVAQLEKKYGETRRSVFLRSDKSLIEVFASKGTGSWTILITDVRLNSCLIGAGDYFEIEPTEAEGDDT